MRRSASWPWRSNMCVLLQASPECTHCRSCCSRATASPCTVTSTSTTTTWSMTTQSNRWDQVRFWTFPHLWYLVGRLHSLMLSVFLASVSVILAVSKRVGGGGNKEKQRRGNKNCWCTTFSFYTQCTTDLCMFVSSYADPWIWICKLDGQIQGPTSMYIKSWRFGLFDGSNYFASQKQKLCQKQRCMFVRWFLMRCWSCQVEI